MRDTALELREEVTNIARRKPTRRTLFKAIVALLVLYVLGLFAYLHSTPRQTDVHAVASAAPSAVVPNPRLHRIPPSPPPVSTPPVVSSAAATSAREAAALDAERELEAELRAIADVADKYQIPTVKMTGGQRVDLLGVKKEDLPAVWADLNAAGMVSGHAYGKSLRTVKTCVGTDWCRFGTQDSTGLGIKLEKFMWGSWTPHKVKLGVSGCPRNCAEATCKDIGVVCVDSGYEIHFAGAAGMHVKGTEILCTVETEAEVLEYIGALTQLYREQGRYLERIYKWADRVGLDVARKQVAEDPERRKELNERFIYSQKFMQIDPWAERVQGKDAEEFTSFRLAQFGKVA